jgi:hypothetical protein
MSDILNEDDLSALAAEYVIGTLDPDERTRANVLIDVDQGFRDLVRVWERRLGELHLMVEPVEPDERIWERIRGRLGIVSLPRAPSLPLVAEPKPEPPQPALERKFEPKLESSLKPEPEPKPEPKPEPRPVPAPEPKLESKLESKPEPDFKAESAPEREPLTPEQQLAGIVLEAEKFSERQAAETPVEPSGAAAEQPNEVLAQVSGEAPAEAHPEGQAEALLAEAAEAIVHPGEEKTEPEGAHEAEPEAELVELEAWPAPETLLRGGPLLAPVELPRHLAYGRERRGGAGWRIAALFMTFVAFGLGSLIAAWRLAPDRLPPQLQPAAVFGLAEPSAPSEPQPAPHGTQFEE